MLRQPVRPFALFTYFAADSGVFERVGEISKHLGATCFTWLLHTQSIRWSVSFWGSPDSIFCSISSSFVPRLAGEKIAPATGRGLAVVFVVVNEVPDEEDASDVLFPTPLFSEENIFFMEFLLDLFGCIGLQPLHPWRS